MGEGIKQLRRHFDVSLSILLSGLVIAEYCVSAIREAGFTPIR